MVSSPNYEGVRVVESGHIQIYFEFKGRTYSKVIDLPGTPRNLAAASKEREQLKARVRAGLPFEDESTTNPLFKTVADEWIDLCTKRAEPLEERTVEGYKKILIQHWLPRLGKIPVRELRYAQIKAADQAAEWKSEKTRKNAHVPLRGVCEHIQDGDLSDVILYKFKRIKPRQQENEAWTQEQRDKLIEWLKAKAPPVPYMYFRAGFGAGMRSGELIGLMWSHFDGKGFRVKESISKGKRKDTKTHKERYVPLGPSLLKELEQFRIDEVERWGMPYHNGSLFLNQYGRTYTRGDKLNVWLRKACEATDVPYLGGKHDPYPWRHTFVTLAIENSLDAGNPVDLITLSDTTGHSYEVMLKVYRKVKMRKNYDHHLGNIGDL